MAASAGRILLISRGDYNPLTEYYILDIVRDGGKTWVCKQTCTGQTPDENAYWFLLCQDGASGTVGSIWYTGTGITGTSTTPTIFSGSGVTSANATDMYLNSSTGNVYQCATGGDATTAEWVFVIALGGTASWAGIADKPFNTIGSNGLIVNTDVLDVDLLKIERKASTLTSKATVVLADEMVIVDSADSSITKRSPFSALKTLFDTLYNNYVLPTASASVKGGVKVDGTTITITDEVISSVGGGSSTVINDGDSNPIATTNLIDTITGIVSNTTENQLAGALALKEVNSNLGNLEFSTDADGKGLYREVGASEWTPFLSGGSKCVDIWIHAINTNRFFCSTNFQNETQTKGYTVDTTSNGCVGTFTIQGGNTGDIMITALVDCVCANTKGATTTFTEHVAGETWNAGACSATLYTGVLILIAK